jgi:hypothetical protein
MHRFFGPVVTDVLISWPLYSLMHRFFGPVVTDALILWPCSY